MSHSYKTLAQTTNLCMLQVGKYVPVEVDPDANPTPAKAKAPGKYKPSALDAATQVRLHCRGQCCRQCTCNRDDATESHCCCRN